MTFPIVSYQDAAGTNAGIAVSTATPLPVTSTGTGALADRVQGNSASGVADVGDPVKIGANSSGTRVDLIADSLGNLLIVPKSIATTSADGGNNSTAIFVTAVGGPVRLITRGEVFNGTSWDRPRGDTTGAWVKTPLSTGTDRSLTTSAASQTLMAANALRYKFWIKNDSAVIQWINFGGTAVAAAGSGNMALAANSYYEFTGYNGAINIISGGAASAISAREFP